MLLLGLRQRRRLGARWDLRGAESSHHVCELYCYRKKARRLAISKCRFLIQFNYDCTMIAIGNSLRHAFSEAENS